MPFMRPLQRSTSRPRRQSAIREARTLIPKPSTLTANIRKVYDRTSPQERAEGSVWYGQLSDQVLADIRTAATVAGQPVPSRRHAAGILAALSPQSGWADNVNGAIEHVVTGNMLAQTPDANGKASRIHKGEDPFTVLGGRKVRSFFANLSDPTAPGPVTVDRHAIAAAYGRPLDAREVKILERPGAYQLIAAAYRSVARDLGIAPHALQAIVWVRWRSDNPYRGRNGDLPHNTAPAYATEEF